MENHHRALVALYKVQRAHQLLKEWVSDIDLKKNHNRRVIDKYSPQQQWSVIKNNIKLFCIQAVASC